jgi:hypothetical protein
MPNLYTYPTQSDAIRLAAIAFVNGRSGGAGIGNR